MKNCAWCGKPLEDLGQAGSGPDLLCGNVCSGKYWKSADEIENFYAAKALILGTLPSADFDLDDDEDFGF